MAVKKKSVNDSVAPVYRAGVYRCSKCDNKVVVLVDMSAPPICWNHKNHSCVEMVRKGK